jgi:hypothetical protein
MYQFGGNGQGGKSVENLQVLLYLCEQSVQKPFPRAPVDTQKHPAAVGGARDEHSRHAPPDMPGQHIHEKSAQKFEGELDKEVEHGGIMPLTDQSEKAGKARRCPRWTRVQFFPSLRSCSDLLC